MKKIVVIFALLSTWSALFSQETITGKVQDIHTHEILSGVNIYLPELNRGTYSDAKGNFKLENLPKGYFNLQFSFIGYETSVEKINTIKAKNRLINLHPTVVESPEVVISAGRYSSQHENAIQIMAISKADLQSGGSPSFMQKIADIPGVDLISKGIGVSKPVIRGLSMTNILLLNNGIRMENFQFSEDHPFIIDEFGVDKVEVIKGPASLLYGSDAVGGVINIIPEKAAPKGKVLADYDLKYFSNTKGYATSAGVKGTEKDFFWIVRAGTKSHQDYTAGNGIVVPNSRFNTTNLKLSTGINKTYGRFKLYYDNTNMKLGMAVPPAIALVKDNGRKNGVWYQDLSSQLISSKNTLFFSNLKLEGNFAFQSNRRKLQTSDLMPVFTNVDMLLNTLNAEIKDIWTISPKVELSTGLQTMWKQNRNFDAPEHVLPDFQSVDASAVSLLQLTFNHTLHFQTGFRYDYRQLDVPAQSDEDHSMQNFNRAYNNFSGSFGGTFYYNEHLLLRANFASAYRNPNVAELTQNGGHGVRYEEGNSNLNSQRNYEADLSVHYHVKRFSMDISVYNNKISDYIFLSPTNDTINSRRVYAYMQQNATLKGIELMNEIAVTTHIDFKVNYSYISAIQSDGNYLPLIPQNKLKVSLKFHEPKIAFLKKPFLKIGAVYAFDQNRPSIFETKSPAYYLFNASLGTKIKVGANRLEFSINSTNLLDQMYIDHLSTLKDLGYGNPGRNISFSLRIPLELN